MAQATKGRTRIANVKIFRPTHVPRELHGVWHGAAEFLAKKGRLLTASGKVNYPAINRAYAVSLSTYGALANVIDKNDKKKRSAGITVVKPDFVPKSLAHVWKQAAFLTANKGRLLTASGKVNYPAIKSEYQRGLAVFHRLASRPFQGNGKVHRVAADNPSNKQVSVNPDNYHGQNMVAYDAAYNTFVKTKDQKIGYMLYRAMQGDEKDLVNWYSSVGGGRATPINRS